MTSSPWSGTPTWVAFAAAALLVLPACSAGPPSDPRASPSVPDPIAGPTARPHQGGAAPSAGDEAPSSGSPQPSPEPVAGPLTVTIGATGDLLPHAPVLASAAAHARASGSGLDYDFTPMFDPVADLISEPDLSLCHLETTLSPDGSGLTEPGSFTFTSPKGLADAVAQTGWQGCDFASNHTMDRGLPGLLDTERVVREAGLGFAGPTAVESRAGQAELYDTGEVVVAHLAYTYTYPNDGSPTTVVPDAAPWLADALWPVAGAEGIRRDARRARAAGADFVVVSMHWGKEYQTEPTQQQQDLARDLLGSPDVDLILGTHVHVIQPCERIKGRYVFYGLGNFVSNQSPETSPGLRPETQEGMVARVELTRGTDGTVSSRARYHPTRVDLDGHVVRAADPTGETYARTVATMGSLGPGACDARPERVS